jgi:phage terminase large subunit
MFEGQFFPEFDEDRHVCSAGEVPREGRCFVAFDYGFDMLAALLLRVTSEGVFVERELCEPGLTLGQAAARIVAWQGDSRPDYAVASPDLWNRRQDSGRSGFEIMQAVPGMAPMIPADDRRIAGWRLVREYLSPGEGPTLRISGACHELIRCLSLLQFDSLRPEDASSEPHAITHAPEALRYALMSRPTPPPEPTDDAMWFPKTKRRWDLR